MSEKMQALGLSELIAPEGMFRSVIFIDSEPYKIGEDIDDIEEAKRKCVSHQQPVTFIQVYDEKGRSRLKPTYKKFEFKISHIKPMEDISGFLKKVISDETPPDTSLLVAVKSVLVDWVNVIPFIFPTTDLNEGIAYIQEWIPELLPKTRFLPDCFHTRVVYLINEDSEEPATDEIYTHLITSVSVLLEAQNLK